MTSIRRRSPFASRSTFLATCLAFAGLLAALPAAAQVDLSATGGTPVASYTTLKGAFDAINAGTHTGTINIDIVGDTTETAPAVLNASGSGAASYGNVSIQPLGGAPRTISGAIPAGSPLIDLNGADNVVINGQNSGGNSLTIANTTASATSGTSTIRFIGGATNNLITNANIQGSSSSSVATNGGTIFFSTDAATANGNDNNTISNNNIGPAGANLPSKAILCNGSTATTAMGNSGVLVTNNNIFDYFGAAVTSSGVATNGGCNTWSITDNRFYQTATRTWTTGSLHVPIDIRNTTAFSGAQGFVITGNVVGYASNSQTGTYTLTGAGTGAKFIGILFNGIVTGAVTSVSNNTVAAVSMTGVTASGASTASPFTAILIQEGNGVSSGNTIGSQSATGSLTFSTTTTGGTDVYGLYNFTSNAWTANNNDIGGISVTNLGASGTFVVYGIRAFTGSAVAWTSNGNNVGGTVANSIQLTATGNASQVVGMFTSNAPANLSGNTVRNLTSNIGTGTGNTASVIGINITTATPNHNLTGNTIFGLSSTNAAAASTVTGIQFTGSTANTVARNRIYGLSATTTSAAAEVTGLRIAGGTSSIRNNMIAVGAGVANAIGTGSTTGGVNGIVETGGTNNILHNSVYVGGAPTAGVGPSYAFNSSQVTVARAYRDNVFMNARANAGATGKNYVIRVGGTVANPAGLTSNNNILFGSGAGAVFGFFNSLDVPDLPTWRLNTGQDTASFAANPQFVAPAAATPDLHIHPTNVTPIEGNGFDVGVTEDFDGETRAGLTPVDVGADAGNFNGQDLSPPAIAYTPLGNTSLTGIRPLTVGITDVTGVETGANAPRINYRKGVAAYVSQACSLASGTVQSGTWTCVIDPASVGGVTAGDTVSYFVVAQDTAGNLASNPAGALGTGVDNITTAPTPNTYTIVTGVAGPIAVGAGETYTSLTNAGGLFEALNNSAFTGNVTIGITSDLTAELGTHALNQWAEDGAGGYTLLLKPSGGARVISGTNAGALIRLNGADRVRIDGSTLATLAEPDALEEPDAAAPPAGAVGGTPALRELTFQNTNTGTSAVVIAVASGAAGAQNNTLRNLIVSGQDSTTTLAAIAFGGAAPGTAGLDNDNNRIENCAIRRAVYGIYSAGASAANPNQGTVITQNDLSGTGADRIRRVGMALFFDNGLQVTENSVGGIDSNEGADSVGIGAGAQGIDDTTTASGGITNALIARNRVNGILSASTTGFSAAGIVVSGAPGGANLVANNMITGVTAPSTSPDLVAGIFVVGVAGSETRVVHNSVWLSGDRGTVAGQMPGYAFAATGADPLLFLRDNAFVNTQTVSSGAPANSKAFAIGLVGSTFANFDSNYNDYLSGGAQAGHFRTGSLNIAVGTEYPTVAAFGAAVSDEANSLQVDPLYVSATDLHLSPSSPLGGAGTPVAAVTVDFDGQPRSATTPTIGADEIGADLSITKTDGVGSVDAGASVVYTIAASNAGPAATTATVADTFPPILTCNWTCVGAGGGTCTAAGAGNINDAVTLPAGGSTIYTATCSVSPAATGTLTNTATVTGVAVDPNPINNSATDTDTLTASANLGITKTDGVTVATPGGSVTYTITASNAGPSNTTATVADTFPAVLTCTWTCVGAGGGTCTAAGGGNISDGVNLPAGGSVTYTASCNISAAATGSLSNTATVTGAATDPVPGNNSATDTDTLTASANLAITKTDGVTSATPGGSVTYTIVASNPTGPSNTTATVADTFPASLTCTWTCAGAGGGTCTAAGGGNISDAVNLPVGGSVTYTVPCDISPAATGNLVNTATVTGAANDPSNANNTSTDTDTLGAVADIAVGLTASNASPGIGNNVVFSVTATNNGPSAATGVAVGARLPSGLTFVSGPASAGSYDSTTGLWTIGGLANGATATLTLTATVTRGEAQVLAAGKASGAQLDPNGSNNAASVRLNGAPLVDIQVHQTVDDTTPAAAQEVVFLVTARNAGPAAATAVGITASMPAGLTHVTSSPSQGTYTAGTATWDVGTIAAGATATLSVRMTNTGTAPVTRTATKVFAAEEDLVTANDASSVLLNPAAPVADLAITKIATQEPVNSGLNFIYTVLVENLGPDAATGVTVTDNLPAGVTLVAATASQGSCSGTTTVTCNLGNLAIGAGATVDLLVTKTVGGSVTNTATVTGTVADPNAANNDNTSTTTPVELMEFSVD